MTQPKALNAEGKCVCALRGSSHEKSICGKEFEAHPRILYPVYCGNKVRRVNCGHAPACHPSPLNAEKEKGGD